MWRDQRRFDPFEEDAPSSQRPRTPTNSARWDGGIVHSGRNPYPQSNIGESANNARNVRNVVRRVRESPESTYLPSTTKNKGFVDCTRHPQDRSVNDEDTDDRSSYCSSEGSASPPPLSTDPMTELRLRVPFLSSAFRCSDADSLLIIGALASAGGSNVGLGLGVMHGSPLRRDWEDRLCSVEAEKRALEVRLEKRNEELERLKDDLAEARQKLRAVQQQATQSAQLLSQKREEVRKQLILEEGRTQKLQQQNKVLTQELDKLKARVHQLMR